MTTVREFEDLGLDWLEDDIITINYRSVYLEVEGAQELNEGGDECKYSECEVKSFAWRPLNTLPDNPKFKYEKATMPFSKDELYKKVWRPLLDQPSPLKPYDFAEHVSGENLITKYNEYGSYKVKAEGADDKAEILGRTPAFSDFVRVGEPIPDIKPVFTQAIADAKSAFKSGQLVYIAQINTLAGIAGKRYFVEQYWCGSLFQCEYVELGIIFDNKDDAEFKCKSLLGIDTRTPKQKVIDQMFEDAEVQGSKGAFERLYDKGYRKC